MSTTDEKKASELDRRSFFSASGSAALVAAASVVAGADPAQAAESIEERKKPRYQETDHVKTYYRVNRY